MEELEAGADDPLNDGRRVIRHLLCLGLADEGD